MREVKKAIENLPSGTDAMYELTMARVRRQRGHLPRLAMSALSWVLLAKRYLRMEELQHVIAFVLQDKNHEGMVDSDDEIDVDYIIFACAGLLIRAEDGSIQFARKCSRNIV